MSKEGGQPNKKDGGALKGTHEIKPNSINCFSEALTVNDTLNNFNDNVNESVKIQDGVSVADDNDISGGLSENLHFLSEEIDNYDRAVVENNTEWLKSRCRNIDNVVLDLNASVADVTLPLPVSEVSNEVDSLPVLTAGDMVTDKADSSHTGLTLPYEADSIIVPPLVSESGNVAGDTVFLLQHDLNGNQNILQNVPALTLDSSQTASIDGALSTLSSTADFGIDKEMFLQVNKSLQPFEFQNVIDENQSNVVIIPQEDLTAPDNICTEAFGDSNMRLCVKDGVLSIVSTNSEKVDETSAIIGECLSESADIGEGTLRINNESHPVQESQTVQDTQVVLVNPIEAKSIPQTSKTEEKKVQPDFSLATISISNDKESNSTKILVDTSQGQRLYQINVADFLNPKIQKMQTTASHVVAIPYQEVKLQVPVEPSPEKTNETGVSGSKSHIQDYFLLGLQDTELNSAEETGLDGQLSEGKGTKKVYVCPEPGCDKVFKKSFKLTVHKMAHTGERPFKCGVAGCEWAFTTNYRLRRHEESHKGQKDHVCQSCGKHFSTIYNLNSHMRLHERPLSESCTVEGCGEKFPTKRQLDMHMKNHEGLQKTYKCPHEGCNKLFYSEHCVGSHPRVHQQEQKELRCDFEGCGRVFEKQCRLTQHQRSHTGEKPYVCDYEGCDWAFSTASKLTRHMTKHTGTRKWICIVCGKGFRRGEHLKGHMITHSGMKPFSCPVDGCNAKFVAKSSLYVHMKKHDPKGEEQEIMYHCPMEGCAQKYTCKASLRQHIIKHFPSRSPSDAAHLDIVPLLNDGLISDGQDAVGTDVGGKVEKSWQPEQMEVPTGVPSAATGITVETSPVAFICETDTSGNVKINMASDQSITTTAVTPEDQSRGSDLNKPPVEELSDPMTTTIRTEFGVEKISFQPKISIRKNMSKNRGSARTDSQSNLELSDRARKRRKLLKEKAEGSISVEESSQDVPDGKAVLPNVSADFVTETLSQGITFRDPETGVLYVQTQLLQDDPPHPDLYTDETILKSSELSLPVTSDSELTDQSLPGTEFVGSTINLQDLVG